MKIEFFTDRDAVHNVRFLGDSYASNEFILGVFYDCYSIKHLQDSIEDIDKVLKGELDNYELGDGVDIELDGNYTILRADFVKSKVYKIKTIDLKEALEKWVLFQQKEESKISKTISIKSDVLLD